ILSMSLKIADVVIPEISPELVRFSFTQIGIDLLRIISDQRLCPRLNRILQLVINTTDDCVVSMDSNSNRMLHIPPRVTIKDDGIGAVIFVDLLVSSMP
ncbi:unnamed protein product, partial [Orchesella dallaii]